MSWERRKAEEILDQFDLQDENLASALAEAFFEVHVTTQEGVIKAIKQNLTILRARAAESEGRRQTWIQNIIGILEQVIQDIREADNEH